MSLRAWCLVTEGSLSLKTICWHSLKARMIFISLEDICFFLFKVPGDVIGLGPTQTELTACSSLDQPGDKSRLHTDCQENHLAFLMPQG